METRLWTIHSKEGQEERLIGDGFSILALLVPPIWAIWHGAWLILGAILMLAAVAAAINPLAASPVMYGLGLLLALDGAEARRLELKLRGWAEVKTVEARTEAGAEELWLMGRAT